MPIPINMYYKLALRGLISIVLGVSYGLLCGALTFLIWRLTHDPAYPGPLIPDQNGWGRIVTLATAVTTGFCAAVVAWIVALTNAGKARGGVIGFVFGLVVFLFLSAPELVSLLKFSNHEVLSELGRLGISLLFLPIGLATIGLIASVLTSSIKR